MKFFLTPFLFVFVLSAFSQAKSSDIEEKRFVQFIFTNLETLDKAKEIQNFLRSQPGVQIARCDLNSKKFLMLYNSNSDITMNALALWMLQFEMHYKCVRQGVYGIDQIIEQNIDCTE